ncbi:Acyl carrier protein phosphodiesterase [Desulfuromusa kysingii]|uniref:Acyl carrier protein phosphodiesterase n=1 Tax=Desulfuromusa kysingii TaxID=37625 RepID=A0A1H3YKJ5_9BACT|nr:ACP phosphodiesterase [Desulfuromusa kysingii]SEA11957.1 Acyl carrier protein phosphodiesterase [Desulfuromusa kysingii]
MNYLAHLYFSDPEPLAWSGSLMGDFVKGAVPAALPDELSRHVKLHRHIDHLTQTSELFQISCRRLDPRFRFARSVLVDVFYDHFLACRWDEYSDQPLADFSQDVYRGLQSCYPYLSPGLQQQLPRMIQYDWLTSYRKVETVQKVLQHLEERIQHKIPLAAGFSQLELWRAELETDSIAFMLEAQQVTTAWKQIH